MASIQGIYLALFGRPADPAGLAYWTAQTKNGTDLSKIIDTMTKLPEATARFNGLTDATLVTVVYQALFDRLPDAAGLAFFTEQLKSGKQTIGSIAINILDGASGNDLTLIQNREKAANVFTASIDTPAEIAAYNGTNAANFARDFIKTVTTDPNTIPTPEKAQASINTGLPGATGGQTPAGGQTPGGGATDGGGGGGGTTPPAPVFQKSYGDLAAKSPQGDLFAGKGNPITGFSKATVASEGIELGLDVRKFQNAAEISPATGTKWVMNLSDQDATRFAYSVAADKGLDKYDFKLLIDTDGTANTSFLVFNLVKDDQVEAYAYNRSDSQFDWQLQGGTAKIQDDGGNSTGTVSQNVQSLQWYNPGTRMAGDQHVVKLQAFEKGSSTVLAETEATIQFSGQTQRAVETFSNASSTVLTKIDQTDYGKVVVSQGVATFNKSDTNDSGPFTRFDKYRSDKPDVVTTSIDINLNKTDISANEGFSYSVAANNKDGNHLRDFIFHVASNGTNVVISASNNSGNTPQIVESNKVTISNDGWYTFKHTMYKNGSDDLEVKLEVYAKGTTEKPVFSTVLSQTSDDFSNFGGNRYGWFTNIDVNEGVQVDNWGIAAQYFQNNPVA